MADEHWVCILKFTEYPRYKTLVRDFLKLYFLFKISLFFINHINHICNLLFSIRQRLLFLFCACMAPITMHSLTESSYAQVFLTDYITSYKASTVIQNAELLPLPKL